jgi:hypothetical protein
MLFYWLLFFFVAFGAKVFLALVMIFLLLPMDRSCSQCDDDTLLIRPNRVGRLGFALSLGRVQWRWCPGCGWEGLARRGNAHVRNRTSPPRPLRTGERDRTKRKGTENR